MNGANVSLTVPEEVTLYSATFLFNGSDIGSQGRASISLGVNKSYSEFIMPIVQAMNWTDSNKVYKLSVNANFNADCNTLSISGLSSNTTSLVRVQLV